MEKFCLKWNEFQTTVSQSFGLFRKEEDFFDVTLVTDDEVQISAHKLVLATSSSFFKSVLRKSPHSHPLIYLSGVDSANLEFIMNYIYHGEVNIYQEQLDSFLDIAQKLKVSSLISDGKEEPHSDQQPRSKLQDLQDRNLFKEEIQESFVNPIELNQTKKATFVIANQEESEIREKVSEMLVKRDGNFMCTVCGKAGRDMSNMKRHAETHIEGLTYNCTLCDKTFRSKNALEVTFMDFTKTKINNLIIDNQIFF